MTSKKNTPVPEPAQDQPEEKQIATLYVSLWNYKKLASRSSCKAVDMQIPAGTQYHLDPDQKVVGPVKSGKGPMTLIGSAVDAQSMWLTAMDTAGSIVSGFDQWTLKLDSAPLDASGKAYSKVKGSDKIKHGFDRVLVEVVCDADGKPTSELVKPPAVEPEK